jgi:hypothetical protein
MYKSQNLQLAAGTVLWKQPQPGVTIQIKPTFSSFAPVKGE